MKFIIRIILLLVVAINFCRGQDTTILLSPQMFDNIELINLSEFNGWLFREGNDAGWSKKEIDLTGWKKLNPSELSANYANNDGRVECWFRLKVKPDSNFKFDNFGFRIRTWAATDLFVDGNLVQSCGNTGDNGTPYSANRPFGKLPVPYELKPGPEYR